MKRFAVIGLGKFGFYVAKSLFEQGHEVVAMDSHDDTVQAISAYSTESLMVDATDRHALAALGLERMDGVVVSTGTTISTSVLICLYLHELGVKRILAKALDDDHAKILRKVGATDIIHPERDTARRVARSLSAPNLLDFVPLAEGFELVQIAPPKKLIGKSLRDADLRAIYRAHVIAVREANPEHMVLVPPADRIIREDDVLVILGDSRDIARIQAL
ncbi:MAG: TrkA family potassium uptake protein [Nitrospirae bacterium]|nr:TrkA family potassium uptake protein [Nitrospirota bacterium]